MASVASLIVNPLNLGLDFTGGMQITVKVEHAVTANTVRKELLQAGFKQATVVAYSSDSFSVKLNSFLLLNIFLEFKFSLYVPRSMSDC